MPQNFGISLCPVFAVGGSPCAVGSAFPRCALQQAGKRQSLQQRDAMLGPQPQCYLCFPVSWILPGCSSVARGWAHCGGAALVRKEQQKALVEEQPALRAAARRHASSATHALTPAMATSSSLGQYNGWPQCGKAARSRSSQRHPQKDSARQEGWG